jgi:hypothetical protein
MDRETLLTRLRGREWTDFEVKEAAFAVPRSAYATVSAFANTAGGWLVFGVAERDGRYEIVGVTDPDTVQNDFLGRLPKRRKVQPPHRRAGERVRPRREGGARLPHPGRGALRATHPRAAGTSFAPYGRNSPLGRRVLRTLAELRAGRRG